MPFNSSGVYTPASGATTATPGALIQSAVWNAIFTDISSALTLLGQQLYGQTTVVSTPYAPVATDAFLLVDYAGAATINLPTAASRSGYPLAIKDNSGNGHTNNITINPNGSDTIEGTNAALVIQNDFGGFNLYPVTGGWVLHP
jgi:hypothetical protein